MLDLRLGVLERADVPGGEQQARGALQVDLLHRDFHHLLAAVAMLADHLQVMHTPIAPELFEHLVAFAGPGPDVHLLRGSAQHFVGAVSGQAAETFVDLDVTAAVALGDGDRVGAGVERLGELLLAGLECRLGLLARGDVAEGGGDAQLAFDADEAAGHHAGQQAAVTGVEACFDVVQPLVAEQFAEHSCALLGIGPELQLWGAPADDLLGLPAEHFAETRVDLDEHAVTNARNADRVGAGLEQGGELLFRGRQALFAANPFADVNEDAGHADRVTEVVAVELGGTFQVVHLAVAETGAIGHLVVVAASFQQRLVSVAHGLAVFFRHADEKFPELAFERLPGQSVEG
ncbi:hypothetical protein D9M70_387460 [compost metagenome]